MELRKYQNECIETIEAQPPGAYLAQMATGLGKTVTFANIPRHGNRMLILSHREELVEQPRKYFDCSYGIERAANHSHGEEVVSASVQTLVRRLDHFDPEEFGLIICDEAHHAAANTYRKIFDHFRPEKLIGFTATPNRGDKIRLDNVFSKIIFQRDLRWGIQNGYLCDISCKRVDIGFDLMDLEKWSAEFNLSVDQFNTQIAQWNAEFEMAVSQMMGNYQGAPTLDYLKFQTGVDQWNQEFQTSKDQWNQQFQTSKDQWQQEFNYTTQSAEKDSLANAGWTILEGGIIPSASQLSAMGISREQAQEFLAALKLAQSAKDYSGSETGNGGEEELSVSETIKTFNTEAELRAYLVDNKITGERAEECYQIFYDYQEQKENQPSTEMQEQEQLQAAYGTSFTQALAWANAMLANSRSDKEIEEALGQFNSSSLNPVGKQVIMQFIRDKRASQGG